MSALLLPERGCGFAERADMEGRTPHRALRGAMGYCMVARQYSEMSGECQKDAVVGRW
jgi:hypothetical protein